MSSNDLEVVKRSSSPNFSTLFSAAIGYSLSEI